MKKNRDEELREISEEILRLQEMYADIAHSRIFTVQNQRDRAMIIDRVYELLETVTPEEQAEYGIYW